MPGKERRNGYLCQPHRDCFVPRNDGRFICSYRHIEEAIAAEKLIKGGSWDYKRQLVNSFNQDWDDLYSSLLGESNKA
ncbi:MAG: excinuclease subunit [Mucilaginibacter sp.]|nr:excinuclease subunit [Mucilaginibacter sp.]